MKLSDPIKLLIVEDDPDFGAVVEQWANLRGASARWVTGIQEAEEALTTTAYEVMLVDVRLPGNENLAWVRRMLEREQPIPMLLISGELDLHVAIQAANLPVAGLMQKPPNWALMAAQVVVLVEQERLRRKAWTTVAALSQKGDLPVELAAQMGALLTILNTRRTDAEWRRVLTHTIEVLNATKRSFKSKELHLLRKHLDQVLAGPIPAEAKKESNEGGIVPSALLVLIACAYGETIQHLPAFNLVASNH